ncbi:MAG: DMT family transporter [Actinobacteria bacterium]|nr:DMT family transporter [Actinomycetota bacterium]
MSPEPPRTAPITAIALTAGTIGAIQPKINAVLAERVASAGLAALVNFGAAFACVLVMLAVRPQTRRRLVDIRAWPVPRWTFLAGLGGVLIVLSGALAVGTIGVAIFSVAFFGGKITNGLVVDRLGIGSGGMRPTAPARVQAAVLAIAAVAVSQLGRPVGEFALLLVLLVVAAGALSAFQSACNGRIASAVGDPFAPTAVNVTVALAALTTGVAVYAASGRLDAPDWPTEPWLYLGGLLGFSIVLSLTIASAALGVLRATVAMLAAQLTAAFLVDWVVQSRAPTPGVLAGAALIVVAVVLIGRGQAA